MIPFFAAQGRVAISLSAALSASGSTATITSSTRTLTVPGNNSGNIRFEDVSNTGGGAVEYSKNGGAFTALTSNDVVNFADTNTIQMRATTLPIGGEGRAKLVDVTTGKTIESVLLARTS